MVTKAIKSAQTQVEATNFEIRKNILKYDEVLNQQRLVIYAERRRVLAGEDISEQIQEFIEDTVMGNVEAEFSSSYEEEWNFERLQTAFKEIYPITQDIASLAEESNYSQQYIEDAILQDIRGAYAKREQELGIEAARAVERRIVLSVLDRKWRDHLYEMQYLQEGIGLRAFAQKDPLVEYQREGYELFVAMMESLKEEVVGFLFNVQVTISQIDEDPSIDDDEVIVPGAAPTQLRNVTYSAPSESGGSASKPATKPASAGDEVGRNAPCPCGSGKKYKRCHGDPRNGA